MVIQLQSYCHWHSNKILSQKLAIRIHTRKHLLHPEQAQRNNEVVHLHYPVELQITAEKKIKHLPLNQSLYKDILIRISNRSNHYLS